MIEWCPYEAKGPPQAQAHVQKQHRGAHQAGRHLPHALAAQRASTLLWAGEGSGGMGGGGLCACMAARCNHDRAACTLRSRWPGGLWPPAQLFPAPRSAVLYNCNKYPCMRPCAQAAHLYHQHFAPLVEHKGAHPHLVRRIGRQLVLGVWQPVGQHQIVLSFKGGAPHADQPHRKMAGWAGRPHVAP